MQQHANIIDTSLGTWNTTYDKKLAQPGQVLQTLESHNALVFGETATSQTDNEDLISVDVKTILGFRRLTNANERMGQPKKASVNILFWMCQIRSVNSYIHSLLTVPIMSK